MKCEDCQTTAALPGCKKCHECRDFQLRINSATRFQHDRQCVLCGEVMRGRRDLCDDCTSRGANFNTVMFMDWPPQA